jgi:hypothetical protein
MDDYDEIWNCNGLKYNPFEKFTTFDSLFYTGSKYKIKKDYNKD